MRVAIAAAVVVAGTAGQALAQPAPRPCEVTIARAPEEARRVIEAWVRAEPHCTTSLELRVVPTEGGLYLFARDERGRVHERVVPDAQSAGVLVASWIADDRLSTPAAQVPGPAAPAPVGPAPVAPAPVGPALGPPAVAPMPADTAGPAFAAQPGPPAAEIAPAPRADVVVQPPADASPRRWLTLGGMVQADGLGGGGLRGEFDLIPWAHWALGIAVAGSTSDIYVSSDGTYVNTVDTRAVATLSHSMERGRWHLRGLAGLGVVRTTIDGTVNGTSQFGSAAFPMIELSALVARELRGGWALALGPVFTIYAQKMYSSNMNVVIERDGELMVFAGVRKRL